MHRDGAPSYIPLPPLVEIVGQALLVPAEIDNCLLSLLALDDSAFPASDTVHDREWSSRFGLATQSLAYYLSSKLFEFTESNVTPELYWGGNPSRPPEYYHECLSRSILLGRSYSIARRLMRESFETQSGRSTKSTSISSEKTKLENQCRQLGRAVALVFIKAFFSGSDPEVGAWFAGAILIATCSAELELGQYEGRGKRWVWYNDRLHDPDAVWDWKDLFKAVLDTAHLPRNHTNVYELGARVQGGERAFQIPYVSAEVVRALDFAREHVSRPLLTFGEGEPFPFPQLPRELQERIHWFVPSGQRRDLTSKEATRLFTDMIARPEDVQIASLRPGNYNPSWESFLPTPNDGSDLLYAEDAQALFQ